MNQNVTLKLSSSLVQLFPGESTEIAITVTNNTRGVERFEVLLVDLDPTWAMLDWSEMLLYPDAPGNEGTVYLRLNLPASIPTGAYSPAVEIRGAESQQIVASQSFALTVNEPEGIGPEMRLSPPNLLTKAEKASFQVNLVNGQNRPLALRLFVRVARPDLAARIIPPTLQVPPHGQASAIVEVQPLKRNWARPDQAYDFMVGAEGEALESQGQLLQTPALPWLRTLMASPALIVLSAIMLLGLFGLTAFWLWPRSGTNNQAAVTNTQLPPAVCVAPNQTQLPSLRMGEKTTDILITDTDSQRVRTLAQEPVDKLPGLFATLLSVSPDGKRLAYVMADNEALDNAAIWTVGLDGSNKQRILNVADGFWPAAPVWSATNDSLSYVRRLGTSLTLWTIGLGDRREKQVGTTGQLTPELFYNDPRPGVVCWDRNTNSRLIVASGPNTAPSMVDLNAPATSPNQPTPTSPTPKPASVPDGRIYAPASLQTGPVEPPLAPVGDSLCAVQVFSQNDPNWRDLVMKSPDELRTDKIGEAGCAITSSAMMLNYYGSKTTPALLNACLGNSANPFNWQLPASEACSDGLLQDGRRDSFGWDALNDSLNAGQPAVVGLLGGQTGVHFVVVVGGSNSIASTYRVNDPWDGTNYKSLEYFISKGYQPRWLVTYLARNTPTCPPRQQDLAKVQPDFKLKVTSPEDGGLYNGAALPVKLNFSAENTETITAKLYVLAGPAATATGQTAQTSSRLVTSGTEVSDEGFYQLVVEAKPEGAAAQRITRYFVIDKTPPDIGIVPPRVNVFDNDRVEGFRVARDRFDLKLEAFDRLSGIEVIEYQITDATPVEGKWTPYTSDVSSRAIPLSTPGDYTVYYRAKDGAGNSSEIKIERYRIQPRPNDPQGGQGGGQGTPGATAGLTPSVAATTAAPAVTTAAPEPTTAPPAAPTTPPAPTLAPALLSANPNQLVIEASQDKANLQLLNGGAVATTWTIQGANGAGANLLDFTVPAGQVPPVGTLAQPVPVGLKGFNLTNQPLSATFFVVYNNNTASLPVTVTIQPQPTPTGLFQLPTTSGVLTSTVPIRLQVTPGGLAKPVRVLFSVKFSNGEEKALAGPALNNNGLWSLDWNAAGLTPQEGISISARSCWTNEDTSCTRLEAVASGLSIAKPTAQITLDPAATSLAGKVAIKAVVTGTADHITYSYTALDSTNTSTTQTIAEQANAANSWTVNWDTSVLPPQNGIKLQYKVCWGADEATSCGSTVVLPTAYSVDAPVITATPLTSDQAANLPLEVPLSGTITKLYNPQAAVFVTYKYTQAGSSTVVSGTVPGDPLTVSNGTASWTAKIDTKSWPGNTTATFGVQVCWNPSPTGPFCYKAATEPTGKVADFVADFDATTKDLKLLDSPVNLVIVPGVPGVQSTVDRIASVKLYITYVPITSTSATINDVLWPDLITGPTWTVTNFDSVEQGFKPGAPVSFRLKACNLNDQCGNFSPLKPISLQVPETTFKFVPDPLTFTTLAASNPFTATVGGRGFSSVEFFGVYKDAATLAVSGPATTTAALKSILTPTAIGGTLNFNWNVTNPKPIPPQAGLSIIYKICWGNGIGLTTSCQTRTSDYANLTLPDPQVTAIILNSDKTSDKVYNIGTSDTPNFLPVPVDTSATSQTTLITLPIGARVSGIGKISVQWRLLGQMPDNSKPLTSTIVAPPSTVVDNTGKVTTTISLNLTALRDNGYSPATGVYTLTASPVWNDSATNTTRVYSNGAAVIAMPIKFVGLSMTLQGQEGGPDKQLLPQPVSYKEADSVMVATISTVSLNLGTNSSAVKGVVFAVGHKTGNNNFAPELLLDETKAVKTAKNPSNGVWTLDWNHAKDTPNYKLVDNNLSLNWLLCAYASPDNSGCLPVSTSGAFNRVDNLILGGVRFDRNVPSFPISVNPDVNSGLFNPNGNSTDLDPNDFFNSSFNARVEVNAGNAVKQISFYAYPTDAPDTDKRVALLTRPGKISDTVGNRTFLTYEVYWPDGNTQQDAITALINKASSTGYRVSIGVQYCLEVTANPDASSCSDWRGKTGQTFDGGWGAAANGHQSFVMAWEPYNPNGTTDPYDDFVKEIVPAPTRTMQLRIIAFSGVKKPANNEIEMTFTNTPKYKDAQISGTPSLVEGTLGNSTISVYSFSVVWNVSNLTLSADTDTTRSVTLVGRVLSVNPNNPAVNITPGVSVKTHGQRK